MAPEIIILFGCNYCHQYYDVLYEMYYC